MEEAAASLLLELVRRTGLDAGDPGKRTCGTDAFAVGDFLELARAIGEERYSRLSLDLIDRVHRSRGKYRDTRRGRGVAGVFRCR